MMGVSKFNVGRWIVWDRDQSRSVNCRIMAVGVAFEVLCIILLTAAVSRPFDSNCVDLSGSAFAVVANRPDP